MRSISAMEMWKLADELSVIDAAILITGNDPSTSHQDFDGNWIQSTNYEGFEAAFKALKNAILSNRLSAATAFEVGSNLTSDNQLRAVLRRGTKVFRERSLHCWGHDALIFLQGEPDWDKTTIDVTDLKAWLKSRGVFPEFFFPDGDPDSFLNRDHPRYSAKLACALAAWNAVTHPTRSKTVKQTIAAWVAANGVRFGLSNNEGVVTQTAIDEISKVANWQTEGGAAKSGGEVLDTSIEVAPNLPDNFVEVEIKERKKPAMEPDADDDIPF